MEQPFVFASILQTGLDSVVSHLADHLVWNEGIVYLGEWGDKQRYREGRPDTSVWSERKRSRIRAITGSKVDLDSHQLAGAEAGRYLTVLRDPADLLVARYRSLIGRGHDLPDFWTWYPDLRPNRMSKRLRPVLGSVVLQDMTEALDRFWLATTTDKLDDDLPDILGAIGVPGEFEWSDDLELDDLDPEADSEDDPPRPVAPPITLTEPEREQIRTDHRLDNRLYQAVLELRLEQRARHGWD